MGLAAVADLAAAVDLALCYSHLVLLRFRGRPAQLEQEN